MRPGEVLALRPCDIEDLPPGMIASVNGTVVQRKGSGAQRQTDRRPTPHPAHPGAGLRGGSTPATDRGHARGNPKPDDIRQPHGGPLSPYNVRRTFREFLEIAGLADTGISLRWYRRTGATVIARGIGTDAAAAFLGHTSTVITEATTSSRIVLSTRRLRRTSNVRCDRTSPDGSLLANRPADREDELLAVVDREGDDVA